MIIDIRKRISFDNVYIHVTKACNLRCSYCYFSAHKPLPKEMVTEEYQHLFDDIQVFKPKKLIFTGGEPLLRRDLDDIAIAATKLGAIICLNTNGLLLDEIRLHTMANWVNEVRVSIDGVREGNDELRGAHSFDKAIAALQLCVKKNIPCKALVTLNRKTLQQLPKLTKLLADIGVTHVTYNEFKPIGRGAKETDLQINPQAAEKILTGYNGPTLSQRKYSQNTCGVGRYLNISPVGDLYPCHVLEAPHFSLGNVRRGDLKTRAFRQKIARLKGLKFQNLIAHEGAATAISEKGVCLGRIVAEHKDTRDAVKRCLNDTLLSCIFVG